MSVILPIVTIQHDFETVIADARDGTVQHEDFWLSCYRDGATSVHGKVRASVEGGEVTLTSREGVELEKEKAHYYVSCPALSIQKTRLQRPKQTIKDTQAPESRHNRQINSFDVSPDLTQIALGYNDGTIRRLPLPTHLHIHNGAAAQQPQVHPRTYKPHLSSITSLQYFPSSRVLLAASADFSLTILDADAAASSTSAAVAPGKPARTLRGHTRAVADTAIVGRGRNVLSWAKDGTVRLWDVAGEKQIRAMGVQRYAAVNAMAMGVKGDGDGGPNGDALLDEREVDTGDKLVYCALQSGAFELIDLRSKSSAFNSSSSNISPSPVPLTSIALSPATPAPLLATGTSKGILSLYDARSLHTPLCTFLRNGAPLERLAFLPSARELAIATEDGLPYVARLGDTHSDAAVGAELVGGNCEATRCVRVDSQGGIWTADDEGIIRGY